jgi:hypothetical protein
LGGQAFASETCTCGNPGILKCEGCRAFVCALCLRRDAEGRPSCLACRSFAIGREEARQASAARGSSTRLTRPPSVSRNAIFVPLAVALALGSMAAASIPVLSDARGASTERHAVEALQAIAAAEQGSQRAGTTTAFFTLEELEKKKLVLAPETKDYELRVEVARDRKTFWARAIPTRPGLRAVSLDAKGQVSFDQGY